MHVGLCTVTLRIPGNKSLKGKRRVVHSILSRVRSRFNVAIAEVGENESWQTAVLGIACVSNHPRHADSTLTKVVRYVTESHGDAEVVDVYTEVIDEM
jgi:uncharacterized protein YlxP (DUF503 family)